MNEEIELFNIKLKMPGSTARPLATHHRDLLQFLNAYPSQFDVSDMDTIAVCWAWWHVESLNTPPPTNFQYSISDPAPQALYWQEAYLLAEKTLKKLDERVL